MSGSRPIFVGSRLAELRAERGWTQAQLARALDPAATDTLRASVSRWESGRYQPSGSWVARICAVLDVPPAVLFL